MSMELTSLPGIDKKISRIGLGTWSISGSLWGGTDEKDAIETIEKAVSLGINFIDTAPGYGNGLAETLLGKVLKKNGKREDLVIATKFGLNLENNGCFRDARRDFIKKELENSLKRMQIDEIDLYQLHWPDPKTPISETAETLHQLLKEGKIRAIGLSNCSEAEIKEFRKICPIHSLQTLFNIFERDFEDILVKFCPKEKIGTIAYSSICRGLLSGKMSKKREFKGDDLRKGMDPKFKDPQFSEYLQAAQALTEWAKEKYQRPLIALAIRWILDKNVNIALWGARKPSQLENIDTVGGWKLSDNDLKEIDQIVDKYVKRPVGAEFMQPPVRE